jgi:hypothetical protein
MEIRMADEPKSYARSLTTGDERLEIRAVAGKDAWSFDIRHQERNNNGRFRTVARGASATYPDFEAAKAAVDDALVIAANKGWPPKEPSQGPRSLARNVYQPGLYDPKLGRRR